MNEARPGAETLDVDTRLANILSVVLIVEPGPNSSPEIYLTCRAGGSLGLPADT